MKNSTSSSRSLPPSVCALHPFHQSSHPPISSSPSAHHPHLPHPHPPPALVLPLPHCHHLPSHTTFDPPYQLYPLPQAPGPATATNFQSGLGSGSPSSHSFIADLHCYTTDCSPLSVICPFHSSSSAPDSDAGYPRSFSTPSIGSATTFPRAKRRHPVAAPSSMITPRYPTLHNTNRTVSSQLTAQQVLMQSHSYVYPPWSSPVAVHQQSVDASSRSLSARSEKGHGSCEGPGARMEPGDSIHMETANKQDLKARRSHKLEREALCSPNYSPGSAAVDKPCVSMVLNAPLDLDSGDQPAMEARVQSDEESEFHPNTHTHQWRASTGFMNSRIQPKHLDHMHKTHLDHSYSCDLHKAKASLRASSRHSASATLQQSRRRSNTYIANSSSHELGLHRPDALLGYVSDVTNHHWCHHHQQPHVKGDILFGSKWEDAERWLRPANHHQNHTGCEGLIPSFGLLRMSDCMNDGNAIKPHYANPLAVDVISATDYLSAHSTCALSGYTNHSVFNSANSHDDYSSPTKEVTDRIANHGYAGSPPRVHAVGCFAPAPHLGTDKCIIVRDEECNQRFANPHQFGVEKESQPLDYAVLNEADASMSECGYGASSIISRSTQRFASKGSTAPTSIEQHPYANSCNKNIMVSSYVQQGGAMPMNSLREVGTQMSSVDGSGSISRYNSKSGSPQKALSPARHNTPSRMRSLSGSAGTSGNQRRLLGGGGYKQPVNWEELLECHRAKLELQALSEGDRIRSFHRSTSNWSSREAEEADLSRSLRYSTPELENLELDTHHSKELSHQWPAQSYSWNKSDCAALAKLKLKEAQIQAWENKRKSKADAKLKRLEENLAKKRSKATTRIMESLAAAQRKGEEMRASVYAQQRRSSKKGQRHRRSLSPFTHCTCFSALQKTNPYPV